MNMIDFNLGSDVKVYGCIYDTMDIAYLREESMEIELPSGITISVAWDHESGPAGRFTLVAFDDDWENHELTAYAANTDELRQMVPWMVLQISRDSSEIDDDSSESFDEFRSSSSSTSATATTAHATE